MELSTHYRMKNQHEAATRKQPFLFNVRERLLEIADAEKERAALAEEQPELAAADDAELIELRAGDQAAIPLVCDEGNFINVITNPDAAAAALTAAMGEQPVVEAAVAAAAGGDN